VKPIGPLRRLAARNLPARYWLAIGLAAVLAGGAIAGRLLLQPVETVVPVGALYLVDQATVVALSGEVQLQPAGAAAFEAVVGQRPVQVGDRVRTGPNGYATVLYFDGSTTTLEPNTEVVLQRFERDPETGATAVIVQQPLGSSWTRAVDTPSPLSGFLLASPAGRFFARGSEFATLVTPDGLTTVTAVTGTVFGRAQNSDVEIPPGFTVRVLPGSPPGAPQPTTPPPVALQVRVEGPVRALLTDARGRSLGYHPQAEAYAAQIPLARLTTDGDAQVFTVPAPVEEYDLTLRAMDTGEVAIAIGALRPGVESTPAAALLRGRLRAGEIQMTAFQWLDEQVRAVQPLNPAAGPSPRSALAMLRYPLPAIASAPTSTPAALAASGERATPEEPTGERPPPTEPEAADVFAGLDATIGPLRPLVVATALPERPPTPERPVVVSAPPPAPPPAPPARPAVVAEAPAPESTSEPPTAAATAAVVLSPTPEIQVVTATPPPVTPMPADTPVRIPPTPIPTPVPPTPVPPTPPPTVPPPLPTPVPTAAPLRGLTPRPTVSSQRTAIAPTATPILATPFIPGGGATRCPYLTYC